MVAAANLAAWHDSSIHALGFADVARDRGGGPRSTPRPVDLLHRHRPAAARDRGRAAGLRPRAVDATSTIRPARFQAVCESFDRFDLRRRASRPTHLRTTGRWFARPAGSLPRDGSGHRTSSRSCVGRDRGRPATTTSGPPARRSGPRRRSPRSRSTRPGILDDPGHARAARPGRRRDRRRGDGLRHRRAARHLRRRHRCRATGATATPLRSTRAALAFAPDRPAVLQPSAEAESLYRRLGFAEIGRFTHWG